MVIKLNLLKKYIPIEAPIESQNIALTELRTVGRPSKKIKINSCYDKETASSLSVC